MEEKIKPLIEDILKHPDRYKEEAKYILELDLSGGDGALFHYGSRYEILEGEIQEITLEFYSEGESPHYWTHKVAIIPLSIPVVLKVTYGEDYPDRREYHEWIYVFTKEGWKSVQVK